MKTHVAVTSYEIPMGIEGLNRRMVPGYLLENGFVLLESERDECGNYIGGAGMDGMYLRTGYKFTPVAFDRDKVSTFAEV